MRKFTIYLTLLCVIFSTGRAHAKQTTPIQAFIDREKQQYDFTSVTGLFQGDDTFPLSETEKYVSNAQLFALNDRILGGIMSQSSEGITLSVPKKNGGNYELELARFDFLSPDFKLMLKSYNTTTEYHYVPGLYYRGVVKDIPGSVAAFSFFNNELYGIFSIPNVGNFIVVPNTLMKSGYAGHYIMYNDLDLKATHPGAGCSADKLPSVSGMKTTANKNAYNSCKNVEVFIKGDYDTYLAAGSNATTFFNYVTAVYNMVATLYRNEGIYTTIKYSEVNTTPDNYQFLNKDSHTYLYEFGDDVQNNLHGANLAVMVSATSGNMGGVAWITGLCQSYSGSGNFGPYAFCNINGSFSGSTLPTFDWDIEVITHEMGHSLGSLHTHNCGWPGGAIDGCVPLEGSCSMPVPQYPVNGGTIMSYCHLVNGVGINFANGFGQLPGDAIRDGVFNSTCSVTYAPGAPINVINKSLIANRECTDDNGITYYWNDNNNMNPADDRIILKIAKNGNNIGNLDDGVMSVRSQTYAYGMGKGITINFPANVANVEKQNLSMNRYWKVTATAQPATSVEIMYPFTKKDIQDVSGSAGKTLAAKDFRLYQTLNNILPDPQAGFSGATASDFKVSMYGSGAGLWTETTTVDTLFAHTTTTTLQGGSLFYSYPATGVEDVNGQSALEFYPNPSHDKWIVWLPENIQNASLHLYTVDGRLVIEQELNNGKPNAVDATVLPAGLYYYRVTGANQNYTGTLQKQ